MISLSFSFFFFFQVPWTQFRDKFLFDYGPKMADQFADSLDDHKNFIVNLMFKDVFDLKKTVTKSACDEFCAQPKNAKPYGHAFYSRMQEYVIAYMSLRNVLDMDSSLRIPTIQSLGGYWPWLLVL